MREVVNRKEEDVNSFNLKTERRWSANIKNYYHVHTIAILIDINYERVGIYYCTLPKLCFLYLPCMYFTCRRVFTCILCIQLQGERERCVRIIFCIVFHIRDSI